MFGYIGGAKKAQPSTSSSTEFLQSCHHFKFPEILIATNNFDESLVVGHGGFGKVYKGNIINGSSTTVVAIKRLDSMSSQGATEFWAEVEMLSKLRHSHLVSLFGYCNHEKEMILVYEYMPNGTLKDHLHKLGTPLSWLQRLKICIGAARGLDYLHTGTGIDVGVIHRDVKSSNILLHESWAAKISDFGLSKISPTNQQSNYVNTLVKGTFGYLDPHYYATGRLTMKSDVYAFGVVLLEVLCRKRAVDKSLDVGLATWVQDSIKEGNLKYIIDSDIRGQISTKCLKGFVRIAERCLLSHPKQRPTMAEVVFSLESALTLQDKINSSLQAGGSRTIFEKMLDMIPFASNNENLALDDSKLSCNGKGNVIGNICPRILVGEGSSRKVSLAQQLYNTFVPSNPDIGIKKSKEESFQRHAEHLGSRLQEQLQSLQAHREALQAQRDALKVGLSVSSGQVPGYHLLDSKTRADLEENALAEADVATLKQKRAELHQFYQQRQHHYGSVSDNSHQSQHVHNRNPSQRFFQHDCDTTLACINHERNQRTEENSLGKETRNIKEQQLTSGNGNRPSALNQFIDSSSTTTEASTSLFVDDFGAIDSICLPSSSRPPELVDDPLHPSATSSTLAELKSRLNYFKERRSQLMEQLHNLDFNHGTSS